MLRELQSDDPEHWFIALQEITGENPIPPEHFGRIHQMAMDWIDWGRGHGCTPLTASRVSLYNPAEVQL